MKKAILPGILVLALCAPVASAKTRKLDGKFERADINNDNQLDPTEFQATQTKKLSKAYSLFRFQKTDTNTDSFVSLEEFRASRGGITGGKPTRTQLFILADANDDNLLDPTEHSATLPPGLAWPRVLKNFDKRDKSDDGNLTPREFGIRNFPL